MTFEDIKNNKAVQSYIKKADASLQGLGFTEHGFTHVMKTAKMAGYILQVMDYTGREQELVQIAAYLHDIGNVINRADHAQSGAIMAFRILDNMGMDPDEIADIIAAIGNHDEGTAAAVNPLAAALILADKTDVRRSRVYKTERDTFDIHDRVNYAVTESRTDINPKKTVIQLTLTIDLKICSVMDYFEIFLGRMTLCRKAAEKLGLRFRLLINGQQLL